MSTPKIRGMAGFALLLVCAAQFLDSIDVSSIAVAMPAIQAELGLPATSLQWAVSAYVLGFGSFLLLGGRVADIFGHRRTFLWGLGVFAIASAAGGFVDSGPTLIAARLVKGISAAFTAPAALALLLTVFGEGPARARALGIFSSTAAVGYVMGMVVGGVATLVTWRATLVMGAPVAALTLIIAPFVLPADKKRNGPRPVFDWLGAMTITPGLLLFVFGVTNAAEEGWNATGTWGSLLAAAVLIAAFVLIEARHSVPMVPLSIFRRTKLTHAYIVAGLFQGVYVGFQFVTTLYYQNVLGWSALSTGLVFVFVGISVMLLAPRFAVMAQTRSTLLMVLGSGLLTLGYVIWVLGMGRIDPILLTALSQVPLGIGYAMTYPAVQIAALGDVGESESGLASGLLFASFQIGGGVVLAFTASVLASAPAAGWEAYVAGSAFVALLGIGTTIVAAIGPRARLQTAQAGQPAE
ncbi:MFS transporter [Rhizobium sp.]